MRYVTLRGGVPALEVGNQSRPLIVLNGGQGFMRKPMAQGFRREAARIRKLLPKGQGFLLLGYSDRAPETLDAVVEATLAALDEHRRPFGILGISYGALVATRVAARQPDAVSRLVLVAGAHAFSPDGVERVRRQIDLAEGGDRRGLVLEFLGSFRRPWYNWLLKVRLALRHRKLTDRLSPAPLMIAYLSVGLSSIEDDADLAAIRSKNLILGGAEDEFFGARFLELADTLPHGRAVIYHGERHTAPIERPGDFRSEISHFLAEGTEA